jgi:hypothetical protein
MFTRKSVILALILCGGAYQSCLPYRGFARNSVSKCIYFIPAESRIYKTCEDGKYTITSFIVEGRYDSVTLVNGQPNTFFPIFESLENMSFPISHDSISNYINRRISISFRTTEHSTSYNLSIKPADWKKDTLFFTYYYNR